MPTGRKPKLSLVVGERPHRSKKEIQARAANQPTGCDAVFEPPEELSPVALKEWNRYIALLTQLECEVLNDLDLSMLAALCEVTAIFKGAQREYQKIPLYGRDKETNQRIENPYLKIMHKAGEAMARYSEQLGLTPVGRARLGLARAKEEKPSGLAAYREKWAGK